MKLIWKLFLLSTLSFNLLGQNTTLFFQQLSKEKGLSELTNFFVFRDSKGLVWISSLDGLNVFDGEQVTNYFPDPEDPFALKNNMITGPFFEDQNSNIWFSTNETIQYFNRKEGNFRSIQVYEDDQNGRNVNYFLFHLENDKVWFRQGVGSDGKLFILDINTLKFEEKGSLDGLRHKVIKNESGNINAVISTLLIGANGAIKYDYNDGLSEGQAIFNLPQFKEGTTAVSSTNCYIESKEKIWVGTDLGVLFYNMETGQSKLISNFEGEELGTVWNIIPYEENYALLTSANIGVVLLNTKEKALEKRFFANTHRVIGLRKKPSKIYLDPQNCLWASHLEQGLDFTYLDKAFFKTVESIEGENNLVLKVRNIFERKNKDIWVNTLDQKVIMLDQNLHRKKVLDLAGEEDQKGEFKFYEARDGTIFAFSGNIIYSYKEELNLLEEVGRTSSRIWQVLQMQDGRIIVFLIDSKQNLEIKSANTGDLELVDAEWWKAPPVDLDYVFQGESGNIFQFYDANNLQIFQLDAGNFTPINQIKGLGLLNAHYQSPGDSILWLATSKGIFYLNTNLLDKEVLPQKINAIPKGSYKSIAKDRAGNLWMSSNDGLLQYSFKNASLRTFTKYEGLLDTEHPNDAFLIDTQNRLWLGGENGINILNLGAIDTFNILPTIHLSSIRINNEPYSGMGNVAELEKIVLKPRQNSISIDFSSTEFSSPQKNKYRYRLQASDEWTDLGNRSELNFDRMPYGNYQLQIQAANADGIWMTDEKSIAIRIRYPLWLRWWFILLFLLGFSAIVYAILLDRVRRKEALQESERLKELDELKTRLYTNITHEFRTPLTVIKGMAEQIRGNLVEKKMISRNSRRLLNLVNQMLDLAKLDDGNLQLNSGRSDVIAFLKYIVETYQPYAASKEIYLEIESSMDALIMDYDQDKLDQVLTNLLSNAIKFTPEKGQVKVSVQQIAKDNQDMLSIEVEDSGKGIPTDKLDAVFDRFYQVDASSTRSGEGTGIGLALSKELVELMEGEIKALSEENKGALFSVLLPIKKESEWRPFIDPVESEKIETASLPEPDVNTAPVTAPRLLIVEDNPDVATYLTSLLQKQYQVHYAQNGAQGWEQARELVPDIIISDVMMPVMDGYELCQKLKTEMCTSHIPIIMLTAKAHMEDKLEGLAQGADAYLTKPFNKEELKIRMEKLIEVRRNLQDKYGRDLINIKLVKEDNQQDEFIGNLRSIVLDRIGDPDLSPVDLEKAVYLSGSQVNRKLKALTKMTPSEFIRNIRLERALILLKSTEMSVTQIAFEVGFNQPSYFSRRFQEKYDCTPSSVRKDQV